MNWPKLVGKKKYNKNPTFIKKENIYLYGKTEERRKR